MALSGASIAYVTVGSLILYSGYKGATLADTARAVLTGNLNVSDTEQIAPVDSGDFGSSTNAASGSTSVNYTTIAKYLVTNGYTNAAAAGIVGCVAGESSGNPESVGDQGSSFGIIQEHGSQYSGLVSGNATEDLDKQLPALIAYNNAQGAGLVTMLNQLTDPVQAAQFYSENFERPKVKDSDVVSSVARSVYAELQSPQKKGK